tara:strand:- start:223 stop:468 length:246 start_codon:yes stop_codon:yes gene_type:complete
MSSIYNGYKNPANLSEEEKNQQALRGLGALITFFVKPVIVRWLWNWLGITALGLSSLTYLQALALCWLISLLFSTQKDESK